MNTVFVILGVIITIFGALLIFSPKALVRASDILNKTLATDQVVFSRRLVWGVLLIVAGIYLFYRYMTL